MKATHFEEIIKLMCKLFKILDKYNHKLTEYQKDKLISTYQKMCTLYTTISFGGTDNEWIRGYIQEELNFRMIEGLDEVLEDSLDLNEQLCDIRNDIEDVLIDIQDELV